ncbi:hypothetical protein CESP606_04525 [Cereibacter sphaeroides]|uniref:Uncharacterized protein n=1 Tax=Cereibacter sphaeroides TaxID=1063 RepID=Q53058_CERSP|nr:ORFV [Cereibacter sphaeroides]
MRWQGRAKGGTGAAVEEGGHRFNPNGPPTRADVFRQAGAEPAGSDAGRPSGWPVLGRGPPPGETLAPAGVVQAVAAVREKLKGRRQDHRHGGTGGGAILQVLAGHFRAGPCRGLHLRDMMVRVRRRRRGGRAQSRPRHEGKGEQGRKAELEESEADHAKRIYLSFRDKQRSHESVRLGQGCNTSPRQGARGLCRAGTAEAPPPSRMDGRAPWNPLRAMIFSARTFPTCFGPTGCRESRSPPGGSSLPWGRCKPSTLPLGLVSPAAKRLSSRTFSE